VFDENGKLIPQAREIVGKLTSYTEKSPSGKGLHILVYAPDA
jgi:primase-polymerase (primpol)-like protein